MSENQRLEELRRRVAKDPASIAFAHLAEEYRRCDQYEDAVETCRTGLAHHPSYLSARVTLGRALMELGRFDEAQAELDIVLATAPENLAAIRTMTEVQRRRGDAAAGGQVSPTILAAAKDQEELEQMLRCMSRSLDADVPEANRLRPTSAPGATAGKQGSGGQEASAHDPRASGHTRGAPAHKPPDTDHELFALFGAALNTEAGRFRDTAREEFFADAAQDFSPAPAVPLPSSPAAAPAAPAPSRYPTLELRPSSSAAPFDDQALANLSFREMPVEEPIGFPDPAAGKEAEEARRMLNVLERWLAAIEGPPRPIRQAQGRR